MSTSVYLCLQQLCSTLKSQKSKVSHSLTHWVSEWQGHLLSCPGQLTRGSSSGLLPQIRMISSCGVRVIVKTVIGDSKASHQPKTCLVHASSTRYWKANWMASWFWVSAAWIEWLKACSNIYCMGETTCLRCDQISWSWADWADLRTSSAHNLKHHLGKWARAWWNYI